MDSPPRSGDSRSPGSGPPPCRRACQGAVRDFVAVGDVDIKVIGADSQVLDSEVPVRQILEQLIARTGIPPFLLGLSWSSTERMSAQQADLLTSEITAIRREPGAWRSGGCAGCG